MKENEQNQWKQEPPAEFLDKLEQDEVNEKLLKEAGRGAVRRARAEAARAAWKSRILHNRPWAALAAAVVVIAIGVGAFRLCTNLPGKSPLAATGELSAKAVSDSASTSGTETQPVSAAGNSVASAQPKPSAAQSGKTQTKPMSAIPALKGYFLALAKPVYPAATKYRDIENVEELDTGFTDALSRFSYESASKILVPQKESNLIYSPVSLYMALSMSASGANGDTRDEMLNAFGMKALGMDTISTDTGKLFRSLYADNEAGKLKLADYLWLSKNVRFNKPFLQNAAKNYYAASFQADFSSPDTNKRIGQWISDNTGGKLGGDFRGTDAKTAMALINTVYFHDSWVSSFDARDTGKSTFTCANGSNIKCDFMNEVKSAPYKRLNNYAVSSLSFHNGESMVFILPDQGTSPNDLLKNPEVMERAVSDDGYEDGYYDVTFSIPKFQFGSKYDELKTPLYSMGIKKAFSGSADFSILSPMSMCISKVLQDACIKVDETGCEAAAFTEIQKIPGCAQRTEHPTANMILNRPFIIVIEKAVYNSYKPYVKIEYANVPLFIGVVGNPNAR